jgi:hypothetical protein
MASLNFITVFDSNTWIYCSALWTILSNTQPPFPPLMLGYLAIIQNYENIKIWIFQPNWLLESRVLWLCRFTFFLWLLKTQNRFQVNFILCPQFKTHHNLYEASNVKFPAYSSRTYPLLSFPPSREVNKKDLVIDWNELFLHLNVHTMWNLSIFLRSTSNHPDVYASFKE